MARRQVTAATTRPSVLGRSAVAAFSSTSAVAQDAYDVVVVGTKKACGFVDGMCVFTFSYPFH